MLTSILSGRSLIKAFSTSTSKALLSPALIKDTISSFDLQKKMRKLKMIQPLHGRQLISTSGEEKCLKRGEGNRTLCLPYDTS